MQIMGYLYMLILRIRQMKFYPPSCPLYHFNFATHVQLSRFRFIIIIFFYRIQKQSMKYHQLTSCGYKAVKEGTIIILLVVAIDTKHIKD